MKKVLILILLLVFTKVNALEINSKNVILYNLNDDTVVYSLNSDEQISIASLTKIMTVITAIEKINDYNAKITIKNNDFKTLYAEGASLAGFYVGEELTYNDLLYGTLLPSGAEAAQALANNISGSVDDFVDLMNKKAKEIGMLNSHFENVTGLDKNGHYSSMDDMAKLLKYALKNDKFYEIFTAKTYITSDNYLKFISTFLYTSYKYDYEMPFVMGAKTGYTDDAGKCLASISFDKINNIKYMLITCGADATFSDAYHIKDAYNIYHYYFENYKYQTLIKKGDALVTLNTQYSKDKQISILSDKDVMVYLNNNYDKSLIKLSYDGIDIVSINNKKNSKLGKLSVYYGDELIDTIDIVLHDEYNFSLLVFLVDTNILYFVIGFILILIIVKLIKKLK